MIWCALIVALCLFSCRVIIIGLTWKSSSNVAVTFPRLVHCSCFLWFVKHVRDTCNHINIGVLSVVDHVIVVHVGNHTNFEVGKQTRESKAEKNLNSVVWELFAKIPACPCILQLHFVEKYHISQRLFLNLNMIKLILILIWIFCDKINFCFYTFFFWNGMEFEWNCGSWATKNELSFMISCNICCCSEGFSTCLQILISCSSWHHAQFSICSTLRHHNRKSTTFTFNVKSPFVVRYPCQRKQQHVGLPWLDHIGHSWHRHLPWAVFRRHVSSVGPQIQSTFGKDPQQHFDRDHKKDADKNSKWDSWQQALCLVCGSLGLRYTALYNCIVLITLFSCSCQFVLLCSRVYVNLFHWDYLFMTRFIRFPQQIMRSSTRQSPRISSTRPGTSSTSLSAAALTVISCFVGSITKWKTTWMCIPFPTMMSLPLSLTLLSMRRRLVPIRELWLVIADCWLCTLTSVRASMLGLVLPCSNWSWPQS